MWKVEPSQFDNWGTDHWEPQDFDPVQRIDASPRKVGQVLFHPTASHVLASASGDHVIKLWDLASCDSPRATLTGATDTIQSIDFNPTGSLLATTSRDRKIRIYDPRAGGEAVLVQEGHGGVKGARVVWMGDTGKLASTGFSKMSDRQVGIWEMEGGLSNSKMIIIDQSAGIIMPFWSDNGILFLAGKGWAPFCCYLWRPSLMSSVRICPFAEMETLGTTSMNLILSILSASTSPVTRNEECASFLAARSMFLNVKSPGATKSSYLPRIPGSNPSPSSYPAKPTLSKPTSSLLPQAPTHP